MQVEVLSDAAAVARRAAAFIAGLAREAIAERGRFTLALSGGSTPWQMLRILAQEDLPWSAVHLFQVDERVAPAGDADRNLTHIEACLLGTAARPGVTLHPMPVEFADLDEAARQYAKTLGAFAGVPPVLDLVHLGLGPDGHTASLVPGDPAVRVTDADVAITGLYAGHRRMTLSFPMLNRARGVLWLAAGAEKREMRRRLLAADPSIPAGGIEQARAVLMTDRAAAGTL